MKTKLKPVAILVFSLICCFISNNALALTESQLEANIRAATTGCPNFTITNPITGGPTLNATNYGVSTNNTGEQNYMGFTNAIAACNSLNAYKLIVPAGTYKIGKYGSTYGTCLLNFNSLSDFIFDGQGSTFLMESKEDFIHVKYCSRVVLENYTMGWDWTNEVAQSLVQVTNVTSTNIDLQYPYENSPNPNAHVYEMDEACGTNYDFSHEGAGEVGASEVSTNGTTEGPGRLRYKTTKSGFKVGQYYIIRHYEYNYKGNDVEYNNNLTFSNVTVYSTLGMGYSINFNRNYQIINSKLVREPGTIYHLSSAADAINVSGSSGYFRVLNDEIGQAGDDSINIHDGCSEGIDPLSGGTSLIASNCVGYRNPFDTSSAVELRKRDYTPFNWSAVPTSVTYHTNEQTVTLTFGISLPAGLTNDSIIWSHEYDSGNYVISNCYIHENKGKGAFVHCSNGTIENNTFVNNWNPGLFIASINSVYGTGSTYGEGYNPSNILVLNNQFIGNNILRNNEITDNDFPNDIVIVGQTGPQAIASYPICQDIIFQNNLVKNSTHASLEIASATNVLTVGNTFENPCLSNDMTFSGCIILTNCCYTVFTSNQLVIDPGVKSYATNIFRAANTATNQVYADPFAPFTTVTFSNYTVTWAAPANISYGTTLSSLQLNATASVLGTYVYSPASGDICQAGTTNLTVTFTPSSPNYIPSPTNLTVSLVVTPAPLTITADDQNKLYGTTLLLGSGQTNFTTSPLQFGETVGTVTLASSGATNTAQVGAYPIVPGFPTTGSFNLSNYDITFDPGTLTVLSSLPDSWASQDIGDVGFQGSATYTNGTFTVSGAGTDIWGTNDSFQFVSQSWSGDGQIVARVASIGNTGSSPKAALMFRETLDAGSCNTIVFATTNHVSMQGRTTTNGITVTVGTTNATPPQWLSLVRTGNYLKGYESADGINWNLIGMQTNSMATNIYVGLAVSSKSYGILNTSVFDHVSVQNVWYNDDIGAAGGSSQINYSNGVCTVSGIGMDIWSTNDEFQYLYQAGSGDQTIIAQVTSVENTSTSAKAAVMIRETLDPDSRNTTLFVSPTNGISIQGRTAIDGLTVTVNHTNGVPPQWIMLVRSSANMNGYQSLDGTNWSWIGTQSNGIANNYYIGLGVTSKNIALTNTSTFNNVSVQGAWMDGDIGSVGMAGSAYIDDSTGVFTVSGSGADIWGSNDAFQYVYQPLYGNGQIVVRVTDNGDTDPSGKAGVMIRDTLSANSANALLFISVTNGVSFQGRAIAGTSSSNFDNTPSLTVPYWLELGRIGSSLTASNSIDGINWTSMGTQTITMSTNAWIGVAVSSKNNLILNTAMFDNITITPTP
ncbi:MAG TPA: MBG domain-containing protein [Candidatus Sulfotelmatobacter sp.]|jgi:hypothetical protein|nr:MBG domain-containing protein [Candidatus Sulfotelmatobacter sp.]